MQTVANLQVSGLSPVTVGGLGITAKYFPAVPGASINVASTKVGYILLPGSGRLNGVAFRVNVSGTYAPDPLIACPTFQCELVGAANYTAASPTYSSICTPAATQIGGGSDKQLTQQFFLQADLVGDSASGVLTGRFTYVQDGVVVSNNIAVSTIMSGLNFNTEAPLALAVRVTFGTTAANNTASLYRFDTEA